ncbi:MAG: hypothetical protein IJT73_06480 [Selenomonadaceae bacterium]|nr:hypothetical protein [Selenomonadaceae bacterium]
MAFNLDDIYLYGNGEMGDLEISEGAVQNLNSYARVLKIEGNTITLDIENLIEGDYNTFRAGTDIFIHVSATNRTTGEHLGKYLIAKITLVNDGVATLDKNAEEFFSGVNLDYEYVQAVTVPNFDCVRLHKGAVVTCPPFDPYKFIGGILIIRCWLDLVFDGGNIDLTDCGIPYNRKNSLRPLTTQETAANGESDFAKLSGQENFITADRFLLNAGDGACMIIAKNLVCNDESRIGNPNTHGAAYCRGHQTSVGVKPSNITNIGGSSILLAADKIVNFTPKIIAKYRSSDKPEGRGLARCYIASNTVLPADEGLYSFDILSNPARVRNLGVEDFGNGSFGDFTNPNFQFNNYAKVTAISQNGYRFNFTDKTLNGLAPLRLNALILALATQKTDKYTKDAGACVVGRVVRLQGGSVVLDKPLNVDAEKYNVQLITLPEFDNLTISNNFTATPKFDGDKGGVCAFAVADTLNIEGGKINVEGKGGAVPYGRAGLNFIGNAQINNKLPIGEGNGSVFILAKNIVMNENSRIGATYSGAGEGGKFGGSNPTGTNAGGGYSGAPAESDDTNGAGGGFLGGGGSCGLGGSGFSAGTSSLGEFDASKIVGGYGGSNGKNNGGKAGSHLMIIADTITGFTQAAISTGGAGAKGAQNGAASFGGGGNVDSGGGAGGFAFIYVNHLT